MERTLLDRVERYGAPWLRYMLTLSEAARTGQTWVVATGEDIGLWDTDGGAVLPMWPDRELAAEAVNDAGGEASALTLAELSERLLPFLTQADANVSLFPNFDDDMLVEPAAVAEDLADFAAEPTDIAVELLGEPATAAYDEWALLEAPEVEEEEAMPVPDDAESAAVEVEPGTGPYAAALAAAAASGALWLLDDAAEEAVVGIVLDDRPALAVFASRSAAEAFGTTIDGDVAARAVSAEALVAGWLLLAYGGHWAVAISPDDENALFVEPTRFALDLAEACH